MSVQVYSVPGQTEGRRKAFLEWKSIDLSHKRSLTCVGNVNYYKSVNLPIPTTRANMKRPGTFQNKLVSSPFSWLLRYILFLFKLKGRRRPFLKGARRDATLCDYSQEHFVVLRNEKILLFVRFKIVLPLLYF